MKLAISYIVGEHSSDCAQNTSTDLQVLLSLYKQYRRFYDSS